MAAAGRPTPHAAEAKARLDSASEAGAMMQEPSLEIAPDQRLKRSVTLLDVVMLGAGTAIGSSIFSVLGPAARIAGSGILITVVIAAIPMVVFGLVYAYMGSALPRSGASYEWQRAFVHPLLGFAIAWLRVMGSALLMVTMGDVLVSYLSMAVQAPGKLVIFVLFAGVCAINYRGVGVAARAQTILMLILLSVFVIFVATGVPKASLARIGDPVAAGWVAILSAMPLMIHLFLGIETVTEIGEEVKDAQRNVPLGLALALALTGFAYCAIASTALGLIGPRLLASSQASLLVAAQVSLGRGAPVLIITAAVLALIKSMNAVFIVYARFLFAMGRAGVLPAPLGRVHPTRGTPHIAILTAFAGSTVALLTPSNLIFLFLAVNIPIMMKYFGTCLAAFNVSKRHPEVWAQAKLRFSPRLLSKLAMLGMILSVSIAAIGFKTDWRPYALLGSWLAVGLIYWFATGRRRRAQPQPSAAALGAEPEAEPAVVTP